jgi:hypothetical protein
MISSKTTDNGIPIERDDAFELDPQNYGNRVFIKSVPHGKLNTTPIVYVGGRMYVHTGLDADGLLIFKEML